MNQKVSDQEIIGKEAKQKILLLEDYPDLIEFYVGRLREAGFEVIVEDEEDQGIELARQAKPDLIILDISLPKTDDFGFIVALKKDPALASIPVIILTDLFGEADIENGMKAGASEYLVRANFTFAEVIDKIKEVIEKVRSKK
jgi:DNA-binding response OmpR family regulator